MIAVHYRYLLSLFMCVYIIKFHIKILNCCLLSLFTSAVKIDHTSNSYKSYYNAPKGMSLGGVCDRLL